MKEKELCDRCKTEDYLKEHEGERLCRGCYRDISE